MTFVIKATPDDKFVASGTLSNGFSGDHWICLSDDGCFDIVVVTADSTLGFTFADAFHCEAAPCDDAFCVDGGVVDRQPTITPTVSSIPSTAPSVAPTTVPSQAPTMAPTPVPTPMPTNEPSPAPTNEPTPLPYLPSSAPSSPASSPAPTTITPAHSPVRLRVTILTTPASDVVEPSARVEFAAAIGYSGSAAVNVRWHSEEINVTDSALFATSSTTQWLVARAGAFNVGQQYSFTIIATDALGHVGKSNITVRTNRPPAIGTFSASPRSGIALQTQFKLSAGGWSDPEGGILTYNFGFRSSTARGILVTLSAGTNASATSTLPLGENLTTQVAVIDSLGAESCQYATVTAQLLSATKITDIVDQMTYDADFLLASREDAMPLIARAAETLNSELSDDAATMASRNRLVGLAVNASSATVLHRYTALHAVLHAATLELLTAPPHRLSDTAQEQSVVFALHICNATRRLRAVPSEARTSLITAASSVVDAGFLNSHQNPPTLETRAASDITELMQRVHLLSLPDLAPGEDQLVTRARSLSIGSQKAACSFGKCLAVAIPISDNDRTSFSLTPNSMTEIMAMADCETDDGVGLQLVRWGVNPFSVSFNVDDDGSSSFPSVANASVSAISVTACGRELAVANLSDPMRLHLPIAARYVADERKQTLEGDCDSEGSVVVVRCNATDQHFNLTCPTKDSRWNLTCPRIVPVPACVFWDGHKWSAEGIVVANTTGTTIDCTSTHMTNYLGIVGETITGVHR